MKTAKMACGEAGSASDIVLVGRTSSDDLAFLLRRISEVWQEGVYHGLSANDAGELSTLSTGLPQDPEVFVYERRSAFESWEHDGATESNTSTMLQILVSQGSLTLVVDRVDSPLGLLAVELVDGLKAERQRLEERRGSTRAPVAYPDEQEGDEP